MRTVWVIESGEYEQRSVDGVAVSLEAAVCFAKSRTHGTDIRGEPQLIESGKFHWYELALEYLDRSGEKGSWHFEITPYELAEDPEKGSEIESQPHS